MTGRSSAPFAVLLGWIIVAMLVPGQARAAVTCDWSPGFHTPGLSPSPSLTLNASVSAAIVFDDGSGPRLIVGGGFSAAGATMVNHIAAWDGQRWHDLGSSSSVLEGGFADLAVFDDGSGPALYATGSFAEVGGITTSRIARWDGTSWSALAGPSGEGLTGGSGGRALRVFDDGSGPALLVGGNFTSAGGIPATNIAKWNGSTWSALSHPSGEGTDNTVLALEVFDAGGGAELYVGGTFDQAGGLASGTRRIARWDGTSWSALTRPPSFVINGQVQALKTFDDGIDTALYVGGRFSVSSLATEGLLRWDGNTWSDVGGGLAFPGTTASAVDLEVLDLGEGPTLYAVGDFLTAGSVAATRIARWDGTVWSALAGASSIDSFRGAVQTVAAFDAGSGPALYVGGTFFVADGEFTIALARFKNDTWSAVTDPDPNGMFGPIEAFAAADIGEGPSLYAGGNFLAAGDQLANHIARWDGNRWHQLLDPLAVGPGRVLALAAHDDGGGPAIYAGGSFPSANLVRWRDGEWSSVSGPSGDGTNGIVSALVAFDDGTGLALYVAGDFTQAGGLAASSVARWDGSTWSPLMGVSADGVAGKINSLAVFDEGSGEALYAGGLFTTAGGVGATNLARWNGTTWSPVAGAFGEGTDAEARALAVFDDGSGPALFVTGAFTAAGGIAASRIAKWDGATWQSLTQTSGQGLNAPGNALTVFDDGNGPAIYVGGEFVKAGGVTVRRVARWDGTAWSALAGETGIGTTGRPVKALATFEHNGSQSLYLGGTFKGVGQIVSAGIARWSCADIIFADGFESGQTSAWSSSLP